MSPVARLVLLGAVLVAAGFGAGVAISSATAEDPPVPERAALPEKIEPPDAVAAGRITAIAAAPQLAKAKKKKAKKKAAATSGGTAAVSTPSAAAPATPAQTPAAPVQQSQQPAPAPAPAPTPPKSNPAPSSGGDEVVGEGSG